MTPNINIIALTKLALTEALENNVYWQNSRILMPKSKALWLLKNDRITADDYCAFLCLENNAIISYVLTIPDTIQLKDGALEKINWLHEWWVEPKYQGSIISSYVFNHAIKKLNKNILIESNGENAEAFFSTQFKSIHLKTRHTIFFILQSDIVVNKFPFLKYFKFVIDLVNVTMVKLLNINSLKKIQKRLKHITYEYINELDNQSWNFIKTNCENDFALKTKDYINWHIDNSQYLQTPISKKFNFTFSTTGFSDNIHTHSLKIIKDNQIVGFISYLFNIIEFNVKYFIPKDETYYDICVDVLVEHCLKHKATYIITDDSKLNDAINKKYFTVFTHKAEKKSKAHKTSKINLEDIVLTDRDGRFH